MSYKKIEDIIMSLVGMTAAAGVVLLILVFWGLVGHSIFTFLSKW